MPCTTHASGSANTATSGSRSAIGWHLPAGATTYSANPPGWVTPSAVIRSQNWGRARWHCRHIPHAVMLSSAIRSPTARPSTPSPVAATSPTISWPGVSG